MKKDENAEMVRHPSHYDKGNPVYEPYRVIREWGLNFNIGSAVKYLARYERKWNPIEDLEKARQYIEFEIEALKEARKDDDATETTEGVSGVDQEGVGDSFQRKMVDEHRKIVDARRQMALRERMMSDVLMMSDKDIAKAMEMNGGHRATCDNRNRGRYDRDGDVPMNDR